MTIESVIKEGQPGSEPELLAFFHSHKLTRAFCLACRSHCKPALERVCVCVCVCGWAGKPDVQFWMAGSVTNLPWIACSLYTVGTSGMLTVPLCATSGMSKKALTFDQSFFVGISSILTSARQVLLRESQAQKLDLTRCWFRCSCKYSSAAQKCWPVRMLSLPFVKGKTAPLPVGGIQSGWAPLL